MTQHSDFEFLEEIGRGSQAITWKARHHTTGTIVAIKELRMKEVDGWKPIELFEREGEALAQLDHPDIPDFIGAFTQNRPDGGMSLFLAQEFVEGTNLLEELHQQGRWSTEKAHSDLLMLVDILIYLHNRVPPVIHRDIKPNNIIRRTNGRLCLVDFGAVQVARPGTLGGSTVIGTPGYMPMEQMVGQAEQRSDLYSLGVTLGHLMTGLDPSQIPLENNALNFRKHLDRGSHILQMIERLTRPSREARFRSAQTTRDALLASIPTTPTHTDPPQTDPVPQPRDAYTLEQWLESSKTRVMRAKRPPASMLQEVIRRRLRVLDRAPNPNPPPRLSGLERHGFRHLGRQTRIQFPEAQTHDVWVDASSQIYLVHEETTAPGAVDPVKLVVLFDDNTQLVMDSKSDPNMSSHRVRYVRGTGGLEFDLKLMHEVLMKRGPSDAAPIRGLDIDRFELLYYERWFGLDDPIALSGEPVPPPADNSPPWWVAIIVVLTLPIILIVAVILMPFLFLGKASGFASAWKNYKREKKQGLLPSPSAMPPLARPDHTVPDDQPVETEVQVSVSVA